jgi:hypothetical protein
MGCCGAGKETSKDQILQINGEQVRLKGVTESFRYAQTTLGLHPTAPGFGEAIVKALRQVGNDIPEAQEQEYAQTLTGMFELFYATEGKSKGCCC